MNILRQIIFKIPDLIFYLLAMPAGLAIGLLLLRYPVSDILTQLKFCRYYQMTAAVVAFVADLLIKGFFVDKLNWSGWQYLGLSLFLGSLGGILSLINGAQD